MWDAGVQAWVKACSEGKLDMAGDEHLPRTPSPSGHVLLQNVCVSTVDPGGVGADHGVQTRSTQ